MADNSQFYRVVNSERVQKGFSKQKHLSIKMKKQDPNLWDGIRRGTTKLKDVIAICEAMDLQLIIRNKETSTDHIMTKID